MNEDLGIPALKVDYKSFRSGKIFGKIETILCGFAKKIINTESKEKIEELENHLDRIYNLYEKAIVLYDVPLKEAEDTIKFYIQAKEKLKSLKDD